MTETKIDSGADAPKEPEILKNKKLSYQKTTPGIWRARVARRLL